jgi:hypothetical protein
MSEALKSLPEAYPQDAAALIEIAKECDDKMFEEWLVVISTSVFTLCWF